MGFPQFIVYTLIVIATLFSQSKGLLYHEHLNLQELELLFSEVDCIEGTLSVSEMDSVGFQTIRFTEPPSKPNEDENVEYKSAMQMINDLAIFNNIKYQYILTGEEGPPHQKQFNVSLHLGEEEFYAKNTSIKRAQHTAARLALQATAYNHPPTRDMTKQVKKLKELNSVQKLENWVNKHLDTSLIYSFQEQSSKFHESFYQDNMYSKPSLNEVTVKVGKLEFTSEGLTIDIAKQKAASNALKELNIVNGFCFLEEKGGSLWNQLFDRDFDNYSPISLLHNFGSRSKQDVSFELISEEGPSHLKTFTFKCSIGDKFVSLGKGSSKKTAKKEAATDMINKLKSYAYDNDINCHSMLRKDKKVKNNNSKLIKAVENTERETTYLFPEDMNPISKLIQIQQKNNDILPVFTFIEEKGETVKEFFIEVKLGNEVYIGSGPNKKTAKRKAAEGMLKKLGYVCDSDGIRISLPEHKKTQFSKQGATFSKIPVASGINLNSEGLSKIDNDKESSHRFSNPPSKYENPKKGDTNVKFKDNLMKSKNENDKTQSDFKMPMVQLDNISQKFGFRFQFSDFSKSNNTGFVSLLSLTTDPPLVCYGTGLTTFISQDNAAEAALRDLYKYHVATISERIQELSRDTISEDSYRFSDIIVKEDIK